MPALDDPDTLIIIPAAVPSNTCSLRSGEALWLTVPSTTYSKIGTEIKSRVQVKSPYTFIGSDYDAQESCIAAIYADSVNKIAGSTQFGHSILAGTKEDGSDMHSVTANRIGISRQIGKTLNYALLYGAGVKTLSTSIIKGNKTITPKDAQKMAKTLIDLKKGRKAGPNSTKFTGGSDSYAFNEMLRISNSPIPKNPLSGTKMSTAFRPESVGSDFQVFRSNWTIQSTGSALLHGFLTAMKYLLNKYNIEGRFVLSVHDSILYMCKEEDADTVSALYQIAHLWTWCWLRYKYGIISMPHANAWFSSVEIDKIFRKSATAETISVSQPIPDPDGRAHTITTLVPTLNSLSQPVSSTIVLNRINPE